MRAVERRKSAAGLAGAHPSLRAQILLNYTRVENAHKVRKKTFDFLLCVEIQQTICRNPAKFSFFLRWHYQCLNASLLTRFFQESDSIFVLPTWFGSGSGFLPLASGLESDSKRLESEDFCPLVCTRGKHGQDQDWISSRILAIFLVQDWIWILIFDKNWIMTGSDICLISITTFSWEWFTMSQIMVLLLSLLWFLYSQKIKMILSACAALITIDDNSCYCIVNIFQRGGSSKLLSYIAGILRYFFVVLSGIASYILSL